MRMDYVQCFASDYCPTPVCTVNRINRTMQHLRIGCNLTETQHQMHARITLYLKYQVYRPFLLIVHEDFCNAMEVLYRPNGTLATVAEQFVNPKASPHRRYFLWLCEKFYKDQTLITAARTRAMWERPTLSFRIWWYPDIFYQLVSIAWIWIFTISWVTVQFCLWGFSSKFHQQPVYSIGRWVNLKKRNNMCVFIVIHPDKVYL